MSAFTVGWATSPASLPACVRRWPAAASTFCCAPQRTATAGLVAFIADDEAAAQAALEGAGIPDLIRPAVTVKTANLPGAGAAAFRKLADAGVNVDLLLPVRISDDEFYAVICADDPAAAEGALGGQVVSR